MRLLLLITCFFCLFSNAQTASNLPCSSSETRQFDFWIGDWNLTWNDTSHGTNHIERIFGNCTVQENFSDPAANYLGKSWSVYNPNYKIWQQTWVDSQGGYIDLTGGMKSDSMVLTTAAQTVPKSISPTGKIINRMVYYHITPQSFDWSWESSIDGGINWKNNWLIHYKRKA
jgi:hypothetical protein